MATDLDGAFVCLQRAARRMAASGTGGRPGHSRRRRRGPIFAFARLDQVIPLSGGLDEPDPDVRCPDPATAPAAVRRAAPGTAARSPGRRV
jgi:hypothetical protein